MYYIIVILICQHKYKNNLYFNENLAADIFCLLQYRFLYPVHGIDFSTPEPWVAS